MNMIDKVGGVIIKDRGILVVRKKQRKIFRNILLLGRQVPTTRTVTLGQAAATFSMIFEISFT